MGRKEGVEGGDVGVGLLMKSTSTRMTKDRNNMGEKEEIFILDALAVERERGIMVKASAASMLSTGWILLNIVDMPGHVDFGMEVSKSLDCVEGVVLLFDSVRGVQAQTLSVYGKARRIEKQRDRIESIGAGHKDDPPDDGEGIGL